MPTTDTPITPIHDTLPEVIQRLAPQRAVLEGLQTQLRARANALLSLGPKHDAARRVAEAEAVAFEALMRYMHCIRGWEHVPLATRSPTAAEERMYPGVCEVRFIRAAPASP